MSIDPRDARDPVHRALRGLPQPRAPRTLAPRVMAAVAAANARQTRPATRPWLSWPVEWRLASVVAFAIAGIGAVWFWPGIEASAWHLATRGLAVLDARATAIAPGVSAFARLAVIGWETFVQPVMWIVVVWMMLMTAACAAFATALERVAFGETSQ